MIVSLNSRLICQVYVQTGIKEEFKNGVKMPGQRDGFTGLKILVGTKLPDGTHVPAGSIAYFREETLFSQPWTKKKYKSEAFGGEFIVAELFSVDAIEIAAPNKTPDPSV